jgi:DNA-damage-inducible protein J
MTMSSVTIRIDRDTKEQASAVAEKLGTDLSAATRMFYKQMIREQGIPVNLHLGNVPNDETRKAIDEGRTLLAENTQAPSSPDELFDSLGI